MPFKSESQRRLCYAKKSRGQAGSWNCAEWSEHTKGKLPVKKSKEAEVNEKLSQQMAPGSGPLMVEPTPVQQAQLDILGLPSRPQSINDFVTAGARSAARQVGSPFRESMRQYHGTRGLGVPKPTAGALRGTPIGAHPIMSALAAAGIPLGAYGLYRLLSRRNRPEEEKYGTDMRKEAAMEAMTSHIDDQCCKVSWDKQARLRIIQANLADGYNLASAVKAAFPGSSLTQQAGLMASLAKGAATLVKQAQVIPPIPRAIQGAFGARSPGKGRNPLQELRGPHVTVGPTLPSVVRGALGARSKVTPPRTPRAVLGAFGARSVKKSEKNAFDVTEWLQEHAAASEAPTAPAAAAAPLGGMSQQMGPQTQTQPMGGSQPGWWQKIFGG